MAAGTGSARLLAAPENMEMESDSEVGTQVAHDEQDIQGCYLGPGLSMAIGCCCVCNPLSWCMWIRQVDQNEQTAVMYWGKYVGTLKQPGLHLVNPWGIESKKMSTKVMTLNLSDLKVTDARGNPIIVSGVVTYRLSSAKCATIDITDPFNFIMTQATASLKRIVGRYPYSAAPGQPSLQTEGGHLATEMVSLLQEKVNVCGAIILNFELTDLSYAAEIAQVMLVKQQAEALVEARRLIVGSAVEMAHQAVSQLEAKGKLSDSARERVCVNLLSVICSNSPVTPTVALQS